MPCIRCWIHACTPPSFHLTLFLLTWQCHLSSICITLPLHNVPVASCSLSRCTSCSVITLALGSFLSWSRTAVGLSPPGRFVRKTTLSAGAVPTGGGGRVEAEVSLALLLLLSGRLRCSTPLRGSISSARDGSVPRITAGGSLRKRGPRRERESNKVRGNQTN